MARWWLSGKKGGRWILEGEASSLWQGSGRRVRRWRRDGGFLGDASVAACQASQWVKTWTAPPLLMCVCPALICNYRLAVGVQTALPYGSDVVASPLLMHTIITRGQLGFCTPSQLALAAIWQTTWSQRTLSHWFSEEAFPNGTDVRRSGLDVYFIRVPKLNYWEEEQKIFSPTVWSEWRCPWCWSAATSLGNNCAAGRGGASGLCWVYLSPILISAPPGIRSLEALPTDYRQGWWNICAATAPTRGFCCFGFFFCCCFLNQQDYFEVLTQVKKVTDGLTRRQIWTA